MNLAELQKKLIAAARLQKPEDRVPYAFEKRIMAHINSRAANQHWATAWTHSLWRAAVSCVVVAMLFGVWTVVEPAGSSAADDLSLDFQNTLLASVDQGDNAP